MYQVRRSDRANKQINGIIHCNSILKWQEYRVLAVERHPVFYKVDQKAELVRIHAVIDARRDYQRLL